MKIISHRGNINGRKIKKENSISYIKNALNNNFDVEIDVWYKNNKLYLGHDNPQYLISESFLENKRLWCHAKNLEALNLMLKNKKIHCFWHQKDDFTLTSKGFIWTYPNKKTLENSILVLNNKKDISALKYKIYGICTDYPLYYNNQYDYI